MKHPQCQYPNTDCPNRNEQNNQCLLRNPLSCPLLGKNPIETKGIPQIKLSYVVQDYPTVENKDLPAILCKALGMPFYKFVELTLDKVRESINGGQGRYLEVRCYTTENPKSGSFLRGLDMVIVGFCGDVEDLEITLIHELLHLFRWDEKMVEAKAQEIYNKTKESQ